MPAQKGYCQWIPNEEGREKERDSIVKSKIAVTAV